MASTDGGSTATGNETGANFWGSLGDTFITGLNKKIDLELASDNRNMPDQNDLVYGYKTNRNQMGTGISPQMLLLGGAFLLVAIVVIKKVL